jgi:hypothetical protein
MRFSRLQVTICLLSLSALLFLLLNPEWQEASSKMPPEYRKEIGRGFLWSPPKTVAAGCYFTFEDCVETPASAFYPVVNRQLVLMQSVPVAVVTLLLLWLTRTGDRQSRILSSTRTTIAISLSLALVVPIGGIPIAAHLVSLPGIISDGGEKWQVYAVGIPLVFVIVALAIFGLLSGMRLLTKATTRVRGE